jgi:hypothetical protein
LLRAWAKKILLPILRPQILPLKILLLAIRRPQTRLLRTTPILLVVEGVADFLFQAFLGFLLILR